MSTLLFKRLQEISKNTSSISNILDVIADKYIALNLSQPESITGDGTYYSPGQYVVKNGDAKGLDYVGGQIVNTAEPAKHIFIAIVSTTSTIATEITMTGGINNVPDTTWETLHKITNANDAKQLTFIGLFDLNTNDTLDFFSKSNNDIVFQKATWIALKVGEVSGV